jgi:hypothetical protein
MIDIPLLAVPVAGPRPRTVPAIERQTAAVRHAVLSRAM